MSGLRARTFCYLLLFGSLILATRLPIAPGQLLTFDDVNLAYSIGHFDVRVSQPQPPGYPLFVTEMRLLYWLHFRRPEHILLVLGMAGSIAAIVLLALFGDIMLGGYSGFCAACMMLFHPVFWQTGVASALRMQLAVISLAVAWACWRAWRGEGRWVLWSAVALALGAGIRPETGVLLFPLWAASAWRAPVSWKSRAQAVAAMAGVLLLWLAPTVLASGGPAAYIKTNLEYVAEQASVSSELFGATQAKAHATLWRLLVWTGFGILSWASSVVLAWRRKSGWGIEPTWMLFLAIWFVPPFLFALSVHVEDPGQVLTMVPVVALFGGHLMNRALDHSASLNAETARARALILSVATLAVAWIVRFHWGWYIVLWVPPTALVTALLLKGDALIARFRAVTLMAATLMVAWMVTSNWGSVLMLWAPPLVLITALLLDQARVKKSNYPPRVAMFAYLLAPVLVVNLTAFNFHGWYYRGERAGGWKASLDQAVSDINTGLELTSHEAMEKTLATDDHTLKEIQRLAAERPGKTLVLFEQGVTTWRKAAYYAPDVPVIVLEHKRIRTSPPTVAIWKGNRQDGFTHGAPPLRVPLPAGSRIIWLLNPRTEFFHLVQQSFAAAADGPVYVTDLPRQSGTRLLGEYQLEW